jgi:hypothetical protein
LGIGVPAIEVVLVNQSMNFPPTQDPFVTDTLSRNEH